MDHPTKNPRVIIAGAIYDAGTNWSVFCYICGDTVSQTVRDPKDLDPELRTHRGLHVRAKDQI
jgi:hypothetical protein